MEDTEDRVSIEISVAENVYVSIKTSKESYNKVLKDAREIAKDLKEFSCASCQDRSETSRKSYG
jgi:hypothetical protein